MTSEDIGFDLKVLKFYDDEGTLIDYEKAFAHPGSDVELGCPASSDAEISGPSTTAPQDSSTETSNINKGSVAAVNEMSMHASSIFTMVMMAIILALRIM